MKRIASIWLPGLAIERWAKHADSPPDAPVVLTVEGTHGPIIHAVTKAAADRGARAGARLTDARALDPALVAVPADPEGDAALVERLAKWAGRWSPLVEVDGVDALRLDVCGVAHLFGGEDELVEDVRRRFAALGLTVRMAIASTAAAAWALARFGLSPLAGEGDSAKLSGVRGIKANPQRRAPSPQPLSRKGERGLFEQLAPLPVAALHLDADTNRTLDRLGLKTIGALMELPRLALARRFRGAENVVDALDRMLGRTPEPLTAAPVDPPPRALLRLEEPATHPEAPGQALERLIPGLVGQLQERHLGARRLSLAGYRVDGSVGTASVATSIASRELKHLQRLLAGVLENGAAALDPEFGFDAFALTADWTETLGAAQDSLVEEPSAERELARLVDRLTVKLGPKRVRRPQRHESHLPERASGWIGAVHSSLSRSDGEGNHAKHGGGVLARRKLPLHRLRRFPSPANAGEERRRPQRLLDRPEAIDVIYATPEGMPRRFVWRRSVHDIARVEGPERIAPEWWRQPSGARLRDYYRVEDGEGRRYWIYREGLIGDGRGGLPGWFIHGLFG
jgi:protein ImuB